MLKAGWVKKKKAEISRFRLFLFRDILKWWSWRELNPRPRALYLRHYMLSSLLILVCRQHNVRGTPSDTPAKFRHRLAGRRRCRFRDNDLTSTSTGTSGFRAYALSGESVVVVVGN